MAKPSNRDKLLTEGLRVVHENSIEETRRIVDSNAIDTDGFLKAAKT